MFVIPKWTICYLGVGQVPPSQISASISKSCNIYNWWQGNLTRFGLFGVCIHMNCTFIIMLCYQLIDNVYYANTSFASLISFPDNAVCAQNFFIPPLKSYTDAYKGVSHNFCPLSTLNLFAPIGQGLWESLYLLWVRGATAWHCHQFPSIRRSHLGQT